MIDILLDRLTPKIVLNGSDAGEGNGNDALELSVTLAQWRLRAKAAVLENDIERGAELAEECAEVAAPLAIVSTAELSHDVALAFWLNLYNALVAHAFLQASPVQGWQRPRGLYRRFAWRIGGSIFTPDQIEHGVLRANRGHRRLYGPSFGRKDVRLSTVLRPFEPRIHAALHCGAESCPPVQVYRPENLREDLGEAFSSLVRSSSQIDVESRQVRLHPILYDYRADFGGMDQLKRQVLDILGFEAGTFVEWRLVKRKLPNSASL